MTKEKITKKDYKLLEAIWIKEISGLLPHQSKSKEYKRLEDEGLVVFDKQSLGKDRFGEIIVEGWYLTHAGRFLYCSNCASEKTD